jgi:hypothetical protein
MTDVFRSLCVELLGAFDSYDDESNLAGIFSDLKANKNDLIDRARAELAKPEPEPVERPIWSEGICGDGAAILKDGVMQPIEDVIAALNAAEAVRLKPVGPSLEEVEDLCEEHEFCVEGYESTECLQGLINDAVARYSGSTIAPIHVSERPWEQEGFCDANGCCWWFHRETFGRNACWCYSRGSGVEAFCLPHWALPISAAPETV